MNATSSRKSARQRPTLTAKTAADLMTTNPLSVREGATLAEAVRFLTDKGFSAAPVIDERGRPAGVLSRADIVVFDRERIGAGNLAMFYGHADLTLPEEGPYPLPDRAEEVPVRDVMTPVVFSVTPETPAAEVVEEMVRLRVHRMFVVDRVGTLVGVVSAMDVLRDLVD